ncbi:MAG: RAMP superfamily CRISPR-associated protein [Chloroflexota bacterium]
MNQTYWLQISLESDTAFTRGDGIAGVVNAEVQHDEFGLPYLGGKTLKGLLTAACAEVMSALERAKPELYDDWKKSAERLFGKPGGGPAEAGCLHIGDARLPDDLCAAVARDHQPGAPTPGLTPADVLESLTTLRRQTAMDTETGAPLENSLRASRVILRETVFASRVEVVPLLGGRQISPEEAQRDLALLAASVRALRRAGAHRNRGLGKIRVELFDQDPFDENSAAITEDAFQFFKDAFEKKQEVPA